MTDYADPKYWDAIAREMLAKPELRLAFDEICGHESISLDGFQAFFDYVGEYISEACVSEACAVLDDVGATDTGTPEKVLKMASVLKTIAAENLWEGILIGVRMVELQKG